MNDQPCGCKARTETLEVNGLIGQMTWVHNPECRVDKIDLSGETETPIEKNLYVDLFRDDALDLSKEGL